MCIPDIDWPKLWDYDSWDAPGGRYGNRKGAPDFKVKSQLNPNISSETPIIPRKILINPYDISMIVLWYLYDIPMMSLWYPYDISINLHCFFDLKLVISCFNQSFGIPWLRQDCVFRLGESMLLIKEVELEHGDLTIIEGGFKKF